MPPEDRRARSTAFYSRRSHMRFLFNVFTLGVIMLIIAVGQWTIIAKCVFSPDMSLFLLEYDYMSMGVLGLCFATLLVFTFFFDYIDEWRIVVHILVLLALETGTLILIRPIDEAVPLDYLWTSLLIVVELIVTIVTALKNKIAFHFTSIQFIVWTIRFFLLTALGLLVTLACRSASLELGFTTFMTLLMFVYNIFFGMALGWADYYQGQQFKAVLYGVLLYYNFIAIYSNALLLCRNMRHFIKDSLW